MAEGINEPALPVYSPWRLMISDLIYLAIGPGGDRTLDECIGIGAKDFNADGGDS